MNIVLLSWSLALAIISFVYLFVCVDEQKPGILATTKKFLWYGLP
jgi:hypothetical protein